jgi:hypothetical protein
MAGSDVSRRALGLFELSEQTVKHVSESRLGQLGAAGFWLVAEVVAASQAA